MPANVQGEVALEDLEVYSDTLGSSEDEEAAFTLKSYDMSCSYKSEKKEKTITFENSPTKEEHETFFRECIDIILKDAVFDGTSRKNKVLEFQQPEKMMEIIDFKLKNEPSTYNQMINFLRLIIKYQVKTGHPYFINQLFSGVDPFGLIGQFLTDALNPSAYTYEVAPVIVLMEETILKEMRQVVGWPNGEGDGIFAPGGSMANAYGYSCARHHFFPEVKTKGLCGLPKLSLFASKESHYSIQKMAAFMGMGTENVHLVKADCKGKMCPSHLEELVKKSIENGEKPFYVLATAGTTVLGAFDPIEKLADVCEKYNLWLHVDAAWGGGALMSRKHKHLLKGIERADSVTWNPHKLLCAPQQCSTFLTKHKNVLSDAHSAHASYLFQKDKFYDTKFDTGDKHIQCGRRADVIKFWFMWKAKGSDGFEHHVDKAFETSRTFLETIKNRPGFELYLPEPECTNICFWYVPESLRPATKEEFQKKIASDEEYRQKIHKVGPAMKRRMMEEGTMMVSYQTHNSMPNFFRVVFQSSALDKNDISHLVEEFERLGKDL